MNGHGPARDAPYGWVVVGFAFLAFGAAAGAMSSIAVFLIPLSQACGWARGAAAGKAPAAMHASVPQRRAPGGPGLR